LQQIRKDLQQTRKCFFSVTCLFAGISAYKKLSVMKTLKNDYQVNALPNLSVRSGLLLFGLLIMIFGCGKPSHNPTPTVVVNTTGCAITSDIDEALGLRNFEYDDKGLLKNDRT
jgi:hypothetical protein